MNTKEEITEIIFASIEEINAEQEINIPKNANSNLFGIESDLDSLGLVNLIISIEEAINDKYDVSITLADEKAMSRKNSPFKNVQTLVDYLHELLTSENF